MIDKTSVVRKIANRLANTSDCGVKGCESTTDVELVELSPFDPIDHSSTFVALCKTHQEWADERNAFAEKMADKLRECRKEIGQEHIGEIQDLALPQSGQMREDILMGEASGQIELEDAIETADTSEMEDIDL